MTTPHSEEARQVLGTIDHAILAPNASDSEVLASLEQVRSLPIATVCVRPHAVEMAVQIFQGTPTGVCTVAGFPHGGQMPSVKALEARLALASGASDVDMVVNAGKVLSGDWDYVRREISEVLAEVRQAGGLLKVIFETGYLPEDSTKIRLCELCSELQVDYVKTSTGFGFVKGQAGNYDSAGATEHDVVLMRKHTSPGIGVKASGGIRTLAQARRMLDLGCTRLGTASTLAIATELMGSPAQAGS